MFLSHINVLSLSLSLSKINKHNLRRGLKGIKNKINEYFVTLVILRNLKVNGNLILLTPFFPFIVLIQDF